ncbi:MAG: NAD(P)/FAD-dependent oxidoreductase [Sphingobacterium composti]
MQTAPIVIIGAGPAGLMAAQRLAEAGKQVHIYEQNKAAARKFLVAGHGGFNLTHSEPIADFITRYDKTEVQQIVQSFDNTKTVDWLNSIGIETYVGSSGKIFPIKSIKPIQVLQAWLDRLQELGVQIHYEHKFVDFDNYKATLEHKGIVIEKDFAQLILALGGGSWQKTGSDAKWISLFAKKNIAISPLESANSGYNTSVDYAELEGQVLKNIAVHFGETSKKGEVVFTKYGIEGSPIYYLNRFTRPHNFPLTLHIDLKPNYNEAVIVEILKTSNKTSEVLKNKLKFNKTALALLKKLDKETFTNAKILAKTLKAYPIPVESLRPIDEVISTAGGLRFIELNQGLALHKFPNVYCIGEMLDWEAPTGGYLLQACFSMGHYCTEQILKSKS